jgi:hypothetical protein
VRYVLNTELTMASFGDDLVVQVVAAIYDCLYINASNFRKPQCVRNGICSHPSEITSSTTTIVCIMIAKQRLKHCTSHLMGIQMYQATGT